MKLYYLAGSCALGPHIALEYCSLAYDAVRIERGKQTDSAYLAINPLGRVPSLITSTHGTITEAPAVLSYIADLAPRLRLLPPPGNPDRYQALRWMAYISSTVHPALGRFWRAERSVTMRVALLPSSMPRQHSWPMILLTLKGTCRRGSGL